MQAQILKNGNLKELSVKFPLLSELESIDDVNDYPFSQTLDGKNEYYEIKIVFTGKTGYGKSTLLNRIIGEDVFETSDTKSCTKNVQSARFLIPNRSNYYLSLYDLPGIGESVSADQKYIGMYLETMRNSAVVVYFLRADQRDFSVDQQLFDVITKNESIKDKIIIALNCVDKIEPVNRNDSFEMNSEQRINLESKKQQIASCFGIEEHNICELSAFNNTLVSDFVSCIAKSIFGQTCMTWAEVDRPLSRAEKVARMNAIYEKYYPGMAHMGDGCEQHPLGEFYYEPTGIIENIKCWWDRW